MEFRILGPLEVIVDGHDVTPARPKQRALLALLVLRANEVVGSEELVDALWGDPPPETALTALHGLVSALRKSLGPEVIETRSPGYVVRLEPDQVDLRRFERLVEEAHAAGDPARTAELLRAALSLFRGEPLSDLRYEDFARDEAARIDGARLNALEERIEVDLALGRHAELIPELERLVAANPLRERLRGQLMLALYRSGRQAAALQVFQEGRRMLAEELGIDPGPALQELEHKILTQDPSLAAPAGGAPGSVRGAQADVASDRTGPALPARSARPMPTRFANVRRHPVMAALLILVVVGAAAVPASIALRDGNPVPPIAGDAVGVIDVARGVLSGSVALESRPGAMAIGDGGVWVTLPDRGAVVQIDPGTRAVVDTIPVGADPSGIAVGAGSVWVSNSGSATVSRISPAKHAVVDTIEVPGGPAQIAVGRSGVWVANSVNDSVSRIDPSTGKVAATVGVGDQPVGLAMSDVGLWVANAASGNATRVDPAHDLAVQTVDVGNGPLAVAANADAVWIVNQLDATISRIDQGTNAVTQTIPVGTVPTDVAAEGGFLWVSDASQGSVTRIDPRTGETTAMALGSHAGSLAIDQGSLWVSVRGPEIAHRGGTLTAMSRNTLDTIDPGLAYFSESWNILALTNDGLVGFKRVGGLDGASLVPDLALSIPKPTDGGRTYTFQLRPGIRYSSGDLVRPGDLRRALERVFRLKSDGAVHYAAIDGAGDCAIRPDTCDLSRGIVADDGANSLTFHLIEPDPDFLYRLALPFAFAVPSGTSDEVADPSPVPATGPYVIERYTKDEELVLSRNPQYQQWSAVARPDGFPDRIVWRLGVEDEVQASEILGGRADLMFREIPPDLLGDLETAHAGQVHFAPRNGNYYMSLNVKTTPFNDIRVRQALNFAIDRTVVADLFAGIGSPTCQVLPPNFPGYVPYCPFTLDPDRTWTAPDLAAARELVEGSGTAGSLVTVWATPDYASGTPVPVGQYFVDLLNGLGYRATLKVVDGRDAYFAGLESEHPQIAFVGWTSDYPTESGFMVPVLSCESDTSEFCETDIDRRMDEALRLQLTDLASAHAQWTSIEHDITDLAPWVPLVNRSWVNLVSERLGNFEISPEWGPLIDQMWVQ
jgi:YVTN family beta-propeller protein